MKRLFRGENLFRYGLTTLVYRLCRRESVALILPAFFYAFAFLGIPWGPPWYSSEASSPPC